MRVLVACASISARQPAATTHTREEPAMTAADKYAMIETAITNGQTVYFRTYGRVLKVTPKTYAKFNALGRPVVKLSKSGESLLLVEGRTYTNADYVAIACRNA